MTNEEIKKFLATEIAKGEKQLGEDELAKLEAEETCDDMEISYATSIASYTQGALEALQWVQSLLERD